MRTKKLNPVAESNITSSGTTSKVNRYTDPELNEFRSHILNRLQEARTDYELLSSNLTGRDGNGTDDTAPSFKFGEDATDVFTREETAQLAARRHKYIEQLKNALVRIENKSYGVCSVTGKLIPKERLMSVPHTTVAMEAKPGRGKTINP